MLKTFDRETYIKHKNRPTFPDTHEKSQILRIPAYSYKQWQISGTVLVSEAQNGELIVTRCIITLNEEDATGADAEAASSNIKQYNVNAIAIF